MGNCVSLTVPHSSFYRNEYTVNDVVVTAIQKHIDEYFSLLGGSSAVHKIKIPRYIFIGTQENRPVYVSTLCVMRNELAIRNKIFDVILTQIKKHVKTQFTLDYSVINDQINMGDSGMYSKTYDLESPEYKTRAYRNIVPLYADSHEHYPVVQLTVMQIHAPAPETPAPDTTTFKEE